LLLPKPGTLVDFPFLFLLEVFSPLPLYVLPKSKPPKLPLWWLPLPLPLFGWFLFERVLLGRVLEGGVLVGRIGRVLSGRVLEGGVLVGRIGRVLSGRVLEGGVLVGRFGRVLSGRVLEGGVLVGRVGRVLSGRVLEGGALVVTILFGTTLVVVTKTVFTSSKTDDTVSSTGYSSDGIEVSE